MGEIINKLNQYNKSDMYPFHMPGHKRNFPTSPLSDFYGLDITEIDGFDDLHDPEGMILDSMRKASALYQADETFFLVNGSTGGILAGISAVVMEHQKILIGRNSHKSAYHAVYLRNADPVYIYPEYSDRVHIWGSVTPKEVEHKLLQYPECKAVFITSPTYEGVISDIKEIAEVAHRYKIPLIVDEAHGAHFGLDKRFPQSAIQLGADLVIQSLHKTMPSPTQTALLHVKGSLIDRDKIKKFLGIYQSSSPSYLLIAGIDEAIGYVQDNGEKLFEDLSANLEKFYLKAKELKFFEVFRGCDRADFFDLDPSRIVIYSKQNQISGKELLQILSSQYHIQMEMAGMYHVTAISGIMDTEEGFSRLIRALLDLDHKFTEQKRKSLLDPVTDTNIFFIERNKIFSPGETDGFNKEKVKIQDATGRIAADYVYLYPPGSPILVPGEMIDEKLLLLIERYMETGLNVRGISGEKEKLIDVLQNDV
ncbi:MAG: aminotransferase class I/II-fold pyridoxal phosphate-dependent enzyme [Lachnospiraceae bacterium]|nr:aminotransferase class I/II-fold pyridoxal phosphate-dependent enzyme [Lachnospiraceae bacterium]